VADRNPSWLAGAGLAILAPAPVQVVIAAEYLSVADTQRSLFPQADRFEDLALALTPAEKETVTKLAGTQPSHRSLRIWKAMQGAQLLGHVFVDEVIGRQDFITYALGIDSSGKLSAVEVLAYRESHGGEIRGTGWRHQFEGRNDLDQLRFRADIKNIAGATLSSEHVTQGVRWLVGLWQTVLRPSASAAE
jgi:H+/Na+-translocating ferredoxin:NAD+ oxidoreductase subunit G